MELGAFICPECSLVFKNPEHFLDHADESHRYQQHMNNSDDPGYVAFLDRLVDPLREFLPSKFDALDFGCGPGPTISILLENVGGKVENYDPLFFPDAHLLIPESYDVVTCTEVVEHFKNPKNDWELLTSLVKDSGLLGVMTLQYSPEIDYAKWWYKNDPTHVCFYQERTLNFLAEEFGFEIIYNDKKSITIFRKK